MEFCCPSPEFPAISPNSENLKLRRKLRYIMYGQVGVILAKIITAGMFSGIF